MNRSPQTPFSVAQQESLTARYVLAIDPSNQNSTQRYSANLGNLFAEIKPKTSP
jgi:hypothetical protein